jgi:2-keto-4-pentenoate hydratase/2-oxohepta-3-ene-1,7-dioic acid hydratase in catechol pathway
MKFVRYRDQGKAVYGIVEGEKVKEIHRLPFPNATKYTSDYSTLETGRTRDLSSVDLLWPCEPSKILAVGLNYKSHLEAQKRTAPRNPEIFVVPVSALLEPRGAIKIPPGAQNVHYEGELVIVIGTETRRVSVSEAENHIFGFTCGNDVSERYWQKNDLQWWRAKGSDTFAPLGPAIVAGFDWRQGRIETRLNETVVQSGHFSELLFDPAVIVSHVSQCVTLYPGDVIYSGTPGETAAMKPGDVIEVEIPGIGVLRNSVAE